MTSAPATHAAPQRTTPTIHVWADHDTDRRVPSAVYRRVEHGEYRPVDFRLDPHGHWVRDTEGLLVARLNLPTPMRELDRTRTDLLVAQATAEALADGPLVRTAEQFALTEHELTRLAALTRLGKLTATPASEDVAELAWYAARLRLVASDLREELAMERAYQPTIAAAVAVHLSEDADWEATAAWCAGAIANEQLPSGDYSSTITIPNVGSATDGDWIVLDLDGSFTIHRELCAPTPGMALWGKMRDTVDPSARGADSSSAHR